jgi:hypothetical protein
MKIGDLVVCDDGDPGLIASLPYDIYDGSIRVVDVLWSSKDKISRVDYMAFQNGAVKVVE